MQWLSSITIIKVNWHENDIHGAHPGKHQCSFVLPDILTVDTRMRLYAHFIIYVYLSPIIICIGLKFQNGQSETCKMNHKILSLSKEWYDIPHPANIIKVNKS